MLLCDDTYQKALIVSECMHKGQFYGNNDYFSYHIKGVIDQLEDSRIEVRITAALHDVVEDTCLLLSDVRKSFGDVIADAVDSMTRRDGETYSQYISRLCENEIAVEVKKADSRFNLLQCISNKEYSRAEKYIRVLKKLEALNY